MSYNTFGSGTLKLKKNAKIPKDVLNKLSIDFDEVADAPDGGLWLTKEYSRDIDVDGAMNKLAPFVDSGEVTMTGEDYEHWRYRFKNGKAYMEQGFIDYEETIPERRSFNVTYSYLINSVGDRNESEIQFDIEDRKFEDMFNELVELTYMVAKEGNDPNPVIVSIEEVPYDGEEE